MIENTFLFTTPCYPYPTLPMNDSLTDATGQRFTKGDGLFTIISHTHCFANHILAQNVSWPSILLEYPRWDDFTAEVSRGYPYLGISCYPPHLDTVLKMCEHVRRASPGTRILLGSYGAQAFGAVYDRETQKRYVDHVVLGDGVRFLRRLIGDATDAPIQQVLFPKAGGTVPWVSRYPRGGIGFLVSGLGCVGACDFCSTTAMFNHKRIELLSPEETFQGIKLYHDHFPEVVMVFVIEEDHFRVPDHLRRLRERWLATPEIAERLDLFTFGSVDHIARFTKQHGWDAILEAGVGCIFIGVESKFAGEHGYDKRERGDAKEVFERLHAMGIRTVGAWMCGWDWHDRLALAEDLNFFVSLQPTYQQITRVSPFPGTPLWERLREEGRVRDVPWEDVHFWSGAQENLHLETHETLNLVDEGYRLLYETWGPSIIRRLDVQLNGYDHCRRAPSRLLRHHKARFFKREASMTWMMLPACERYAPNGIVRRRIRKIDEKYRRLVGEPTAVMTTIASGIDKLAIIAKVQDFISPQNRFVKEEPFKRYIYDKRAGGGTGGRGGYGASPIPYRTEVPGPMDPGFRAELRYKRHMWAAMRLVAQGVRLRRRARGDREIDDFLMERLRRGRFGLGF